MFLGILHDEYEMSQGTVHALARSTSFAES